MSNLAYKDLTLALLDLNLKRDELGDFRVRVIDPPTEILVPYRPAELALDLQMLRMERTRPEDLIGLGKKLADRLLPEGVIRTLFRTTLSAISKNQGIRLRLVIGAPILAQLPWEYAYLAPAEGKHPMDGFIALNPQISIVRHAPLPEGLTTLRTDSKRLKLAMVTANPGEYARSDPSWHAETVRDALNSLNVVPVILENASRDDLSGVLSGGADLFLFAGFSQPIGPSIVLRDANSSKAGILLDADLLAIQLRAAGVRVAILAVEDVGRHDGLVGGTQVAPALIQSGIPSVVLIPYPLESESTHAFAGAFFPALASSLSIDEAAVASRLALFSTRGQESRDWGVPMIYSRSSDGLLFPHLAQTASAARTSHEVEMNIGTIEQSGQVVGIDIGEL